MNTRLISLSLVVVLMQASVLAQEQPKVNIAFDTRFDFSYEDAKDGGSSSGFHGRYFNLMINGQLNEKLLYSFRQRLNKQVNAGNDVFSATDWLYMTYKPTQHWAFSAGKQIAAIGGYEYDAAPINVYYGSMYWNNIACYQFGISGAYISGDGNHSILLQVCNSPYKAIGESCYAYNLMWNGCVGVWKTIWSVNMLEYERGHYAEYITLGNRFDFGVFDLEVDLMNRHYEHSKFWLGDYSVIGKATYNICNYVHVFAKGGYERFNPVYFDPNGNAATVEKPFYGGGIEVFPIKKYPNFRLHALWALHHGGAGDEVQEFIAGLTWKVNVFKWK